MSSLLFNILGYYAIFALATGITAYFSIYRPILMQVAEEIEDVCSYEICAPFQTALILIAINAFFAPFMFKMVLTGPSKEFVETYVSRILGEDVKVETDEDEDEK